MDLNPPPIGLALNPWGATNSTEFVKIGAHRIECDGRMAESDSEGVRTPPPVIYLTFMVLGVGLQFRWPLNFLPYQTPIPLGLAAIALGLVLIAWSVRTFLAAKTGFEHRKPTTTLISSGPFRYSRNPIYVGMTLFGLGLGAFLDNLWIVLLMLPAVLVIRFFVVAREEAFLASRFGEDYRRYKASVRRWI